MSDVLAVFLLLAMFVALVWGTITLARKHLYSQPYYTDILILSILNGIVAGMAAVYLSAIAFFEGPTPTFIGFSRCGLISGAVCGFILGIPSSFFLDMLRYWINKNETSADENFAANFSLSIFVGGSGGLIGTAGLYYVGKTLESNLPIGFLCVSNVLIGVALAIVIAIGVIRLFGKKKKKKKKRVQAKVVREKVDKTPQEW